MPAKRRTAASTKNQKASPAIPGPSGASGGAGRVAGRRGDMRGKSALADQRAARAAQKKGTPTIRGEKTVRRTGKSVDIKSKKSLPPPMHPDIGPATDRRRQIVGTDDPRGKAK